jgi:hypothetical protein
MNAPGSSRAIRFGLRFGMHVLAGCALLGLSPAAWVPDSWAKPPAPAREQPPTDDQIDGWIQQLGDDAYTVRQTAADRLLDAGSVARGPLLSVAEGPDPEVRAAARRLVALIDESEFQRRLSAFAADTDGRMGLSLPGWEAFRGLVGDDAGARELFVEMQQQEASLLEQMFGDAPNADGSVWESRLLRLLRRRTLPGRGVVKPSIGSCATMLFLGSLEESDVSDQAAMHLYRLIQQPPMRETLAADNGSAGRRLVVAWITHCPNKHPTVLRQRFQLALKHQLTEALPLALAVSHGDPEYLTVDPLVRATAILSVGKLGSREDTAKLEPLLEDATVCVDAGRTTDATHRKLSKVQIRDVALAVILQLNDQDLKEYGFIQARRHPESLYLVNTLGLPDDTERSRAIAKWRKWRADHPANGKGG